LSSPLVTFRFSQLSIVTGLPDFIQAEDARPATDDRRVCLDLASGFESAPAGAAHDAPAERRQKSLGSEHLLCPVLRRSGNRDNFTRDMSAAAVLFQREEST